MSVKNAVIIGSPKGNRIRAGTRILFFYFLAGENNKSFWQNGVYNERKRQVTLQNNERVA